MGDKASLVRARQELEDLYLGVPDESVNVTLKDMAVLQQQNGVLERKISNLDIVHETTSVHPKEGLDMSKSLSLDFRKGLQAANERRGSGGVVDVGEIYKEPSTPTAGPRRNKYSTRSALDDSFAYNDVSMMSRTAQSPYEEKGGGYEERGRRRPGIPHTNICTICSEYIYIFRHRCLVCGRAYCRHCAIVGMGEMTEGRKCIECLGRRFSQRYIKRAGKVGCCTGYPRTVKQQELVWAEKGPRRSGERRYGSGRSGMVSRSRSPASVAMTTTPTRTVVSNPPSFVMQSPYSPHHAIPF